MNSSLAAVHPELISEWSDKNGDLKPGMFLTDLTRRYGGLENADMCGGQA